MAAARGKEEAALPQSLLWLLPHLGYLLPVGRGAPQCLLGLVVPKAYVVGGVRLASPPLPDDLLAGSQRRPARSVRAAHGCASRGSGLGTGSGGASADCGDRRASVSLTRSVRLVSGSSPRGRAAACPPDSPGVCGEAAARVGSARVLEARWGTCANQAERVDSGACPPRAFPAVDGSREV